ncbi:MAG TPA: hypothetical protein ENG72_02860 [Thermococcus sp.]|nr:hypothetical protein [Candidatus Baldrarchaeota archaeon]HDG64293.1 hypothetical protein [Thermococcus sp.]
MQKISEKDIKKIENEVKKEFPNDPALQQIHIARKIISKEAEITGLSFLEYIKSQRKHIKLRKIIK